GRGRRAGPLRGPAAQAAARRAARPAPPLAAGAGARGRAGGAGPLRAALRPAWAARGGRARVVEGACNGMCYAAPACEVRRAGWPRALVERLAPARVPAFLDCLSADGDFGRVPLAGVVWAEAGWRGLTPVGRHPFWTRQERVLLARAGAIDPGDLDD